MADFYPMLDKAVSSTSGHQNSEIRRSVYERARNAMLAEFRKIIPAMSEEQLKAEELNLDEAIVMIEAKYSKVISPPAPSVSTIQPTQDTLPAPAPIVIGEETKEDTLAELPREARYKGKVESYKLEEKKGWIRLIGEPNEAIKDYATFAASDFKADTPPIKGEDVEISLKPNNKERAPRAIKIERLVQRFRGKVIKWLDEEQYGFIRCDAFPKDVFCRYNQIQAEGPRELIEGEEVEFGIEITEKGPYALQVRTFQSRFALERFADIEKLRSGELLNFLAGHNGKDGLAQAEDWTYKQKNKKYPHPVLFSYIVYTFAQLLDENKIAFAQDKNGRKVACGNTGLLTNLQEDIFAFFIQNRDRSTKQEWALERFVTTGDPRLNPFSKLPDIANYFNRPDDLIFDASLELRERAEHILKHNFDRFPDELQKNPHQLKQNYDGSLVNARKRVRRNYKTAVPQFHKGQLQLLLPLCMTQSNVADLALVISKQGETYIASTILELDDAYNNARLIARPDREWL